MAKAARTASKSTWNSLYLDPVAWRPAETQPSSKKNHHAVKDAHSASGQKCSKAALKDPTRSKSDGARNPRLRGQRTASTKAANGTNPGQPESAGEPI